MSINIVIFNNINKPTTSTTTLFPQTQNSFLNNSQLTTPIEQNQTFTIVSCRHGVWWSAREEYWELFRTSRFGQRRIAARKHWEANLIFHPTCSFKIFLLIFITFVAFHWFSTTKTTFSPSQPSPVITFGRWEVYRYRPKPSVWPTVGNRKSFGSVSDVILDIPILSVGSR